MYEKNKKNNMKYRLENLKAIGFDLDNTLYAQTPEITELITDYICNNVSVCLGMDYKVVREVYLKATAELQSARRALKLLGMPQEICRTLVQEALENANIADALTKDERLCSMLSKMSKNYQIYLITSNSKDQTKKKLNALGLENDMFHPLLDSNVKYLRDDGEAFIYVSAALNLSLRNMMFVGDREKVDIIPAANLGMLTAIVNAKSDLAHFELQTIHDLEKILA